MPKTPLNKGLMYVKAYVNDKLTEAMVDKGAIHNRICGWGKETKVPCIQGRSMAYGSQFCYQATLRCSMGGYPTYWHLGKQDGLYSGIDGWLQCCVRDGLPMQGQDSATILSMFHDILEKETPFIVLMVTKGMLITLLLSAMQVKKGLKKK